jgi:glycosyltransferase involved in cell wall biosynthesis
MNTSHGRSSLSIVVNNYNYADYIGAALDSVLSQMDDADELILVDDGSTDNSLAVVKSYSDAQVVRLIEQPNQGQMKAVRTGIKAAERDIIVLLDSDDYFFDGYLDRLREIYHADPAVSFVLSKPEVIGEGHGNPTQMRRSFEKMEFPAGRIGPTRWATLMFFEFVGAPTSGISFRREFAKQVLTIPEKLDQTISLNPVLRRILGIPLHEANKNGFSADGVIVRCASAIDEIKYYNDQPSFAYRIHGSNKFASVPLHGRLYLRGCRKRLLIRLLADTFAIRTPATSVELVHEIRNRSWPKHFFRRLRLRMEYCIANIKTSGSFREKVTTLAVALGLAR